MMNTFQQILCNLVCFSIFMDCNVLKMTTIAVNSSDQNTNGVASTTSKRPCLQQGRIYTERNWYGYLLSKEFHRDYAKVTFKPLNRF